MADDKKLDELGVQTTRRDFLRLASGSALGGGLLALGGPALAGGKAAPFKPAQEAPGFWRKVRNQFVLDPHSTYMNIGTTGSMPRDVLQNYDDYNRLVARDPASMGGEWGGFPYTTGLVERIAPQFGAEPSEIVLSRNTTDGTTSVLGGLNLKAGDEVLYSHHEHVAVDSPLHILAQRFGVTVTPVEIPVFPMSDNEYVQAFEDAITPDTRLIVFSHITYKTGVRLPAKKICQLAKDKNIATLVDGAHTIGMIDLDFHDIDCDFYAGSGHKWQCGPGATGILYVRDGANRLAEYWPDRVPGYFPVNSSLAEYTGFFPLNTIMQYVGNDNYPAKRALADACDLWAAIGRDRIEQRVLDLSAYCKQLIRDAFGADVTLYSPDIRELSSGITSFNPFTDRTDLTTLNLFRDRLRDDYGFIVRTTDFKVHLSDENEEHAVRVSTHLFHDERDVEGLVAAMWDLYQRM
jgi:selenocysteine lyase/cysteine desulfurase